MPTARKNLVSLDETPFYHCIGRCVRRAFLWGEDVHTGQDFSHRKSWVTRRLAQLAQVFTINICAYAVMSNHYHLVLHIDRKKALTLSNVEVALRWSRVFSLPLIVQKYIEEEPLSKTEENQAISLIGSFRHRLYDISWYMRCLNEFIARRANQEDQCTGRFWEGRYKSIAILDDPGLVACCAYVDLNPIRAGLSKMPEDSDFTSVQQRIRELINNNENKVEMETIDRENIENDPGLAQPQWLKERDDFRLSNEPPLFSFIGSNHSVATSGISFHLKDYLALVRWMANLLIDEQYSKSPLHPHPLFSKVGLHVLEFKNHIKQHSFSKGTVIGTKQKLKNFAKKMKKRFVSGVRLSIDQVLSC